MAIKTLYILGTAAPSPNFFGQLQDGGTAPTAANSTYGWLVGTTSTSTPYFASRLGASSTSSASAFTDPIGIFSSGPTKGSDATNAGAGDSFITPAYTGTFAGTAWTFNFNMRATVAGAIGNIAAQVWKSANADGSAATKLQATFQCANITLSTTVDTNSSITIVMNSGSPIVLSNEYLFIQLEWVLTTASANGSSDVLFRIGTATIVTPDFSGGGGPVVTQLPITVAPLHLAVTGIRSILRQKAITTITSHPAVTGIRSILRQKAITTITSHQVVTGIRSVQSFRTITLTSSESLTRISNISRVLGVFNPEAFTLFSISSRFRTVTLSIAETLTAIPTYQTFGTRKLVTINPMLSMITGANFVNKNVTGKLLVIQPSLSKFVMSISRVTVFFNSSAVYLIRSVTKMLVFVDPELVSRVTAKITAKFLQISSPEILTLARISSKFRTITLSIVETITTVRQYIHIVSITSSEFYSDVIDSVSHIITVTSNEVLTLTRIKSLLRTIYLTSSQLYADVIGSISHIIIVTSSEVLTLTRVKSLLRTITLTSSELYAGIIRSISHIVAVVSGETLTLAKIPGRFRVFSIGELVTAVTQFQSGVVVNQKLISLVSSQLYADVIGSISRIITVITNEVLTLTRVKSLLRTISITSSELYADVIGSVSHVITTASPESLTLARVSSRFRVVTLSISESLSLSQIKTFFRTVTLTSSEFLSLVRLSSRMLTLASSEAVFLVRVVTRSIVATSSEALTAVRQAVKIVKTTLAEVLTYSAIRTKLQSILTTNPQIFTRAISTTKTFTFSTGEFITHITLTSRTIIVHTAISILMSTRNTAYGIFQQSQILSSARAITSIRSLVSSEAISLVKVFSRIKQFSSPEIVTQFNQKAFFKTLSTLIGQLITRQVTRPELAVFAQSQVASVSRVVGRLTTLTQSQLYSLIRLTGRLASFVSHEVVTQFNQRAFLKTVSILHPEIVTRVAMVSFYRTLSFINSSVVAIGKIPSRIIAVTQSELVSAVKLLSRLATFVSHGVLTSSFGKLFTRSLSVVSPETLVSLRSSLRQFLLFQSQIITRSSIARRLVSFIQAESVQRLVSVVKRVGLVSGEILLLPRPNRAKIVLIYDSSILLVKGTVAHIVNIVINQNFLKTAIEVLIRLSQTQVVQGSRSVYLTLSLYSRSLVTTIAGKLRGVLAYIKTSQVWGYVTNKFWYLPNFLQPGGMLSFEWINVKGDWIPIASGLVQDIAIGIVLEVRRGECFIAYTPSLDITPTMPYSVDNQGDIHLIADREIVWIRSADPSAYITVKGRIEYTFKTKMAA